MEGPSGSGADGGAGYGGEDRADLIYFEPQTAALCGVHALNTLLQGPYFSEVELAQIAHELDALEHKLMLEAGMESADYLQFVAEESGNVADHGMFSIQVLDKALEVWGLRAVNINSPEAASAKAEPHHQRAFICNLAEHWFTIREIWGQWWNLNSVFSAPEPLSQFYLSAFLGTLQQQGYTIFVIRGHLPPEPHPDCRTREGPGRWFTPEEARQAQQASKELKQQGFLKAAYQGVLSKASAAGNLLRLQGAGSKRAHQDFEGGDNPDLARALAASLEDREEGPGLGAGTTAQRRAAPRHADEDADLAAAIAASLAEHAQQAGPSSAAGGPGAAEGGLEPMDEDPHLAAAIEASLQQHVAPKEQQQQQQQQQQQEEEQQAEPVAAEPKEAEGAAAAQPVLPELGPEPETGGEGVIEVGVRLPDGSRHTRRFRAGEETVGHVAAMAAAQGVDMAKHRLSQRFPRKTFEDLSQTLQEAGIGNKEMLGIDSI